MATTNGSTSDPYVAVGHPGDAWRAQAAAQGKTGSQRLLRTGLIDPPDAVRTSMELAPGEQVAIRSRLIFADNEPIEIATSYYPASLAASTSLAGTSKIPGGAIRALVDSGHAPVDVTEVVNARHPGPEEAATLGVPHDESMLELVRISRDASNRIVEYSINVSVSRLAGPQIYRRRVPAQ